jgi:hypothetical protein
MWQAKPSTSHRRRRGTQGFEKAAKTTTQHGRGHDPDPDPENLANDIRNFQDENMKKSGASQGQPASELISKRIDELGDWRGEPQIWATALTPAASHNFRVLISLIEKEFGNIE